MIISILPVTAHTHLWSLATLRAASMASRLSALESTPLDLVSMPERDIISEALPFMIVGCTSARRSTIASFLNCVAPTPTGSKTMPILWSFAVFPAFIIVLRDAPFIIP